ncbi:hypothetical protein FE257_006360 [Aspergillus nanangensis]|uniref:BZIP domain-containing protein n=1 Tax=Aspergillus nanangensis TaxID=2582783 RepID=A0AAD4GYX6_ASPNN|nr:hypothetical protein FE257_006360 [Aspergillus nanangensis]
MTSPMNPNSFRVAFRHGQPTPPCDLPCEQTEPASAAFRVQKPGQGKQVALGKNRKAAAKCREKKKKAHEKLMKEYDLVSEKNQHLKAENKELKDEILQVKLRLLQLAEKGCPILLSDIQNMNKKVVEDSPPQASIEIDPLPSLPFDTEFNQTMNQLEAVSMPFYGDWINFDGLGC